MDVKAETNITEKEGSSPGTQAQAAAGRLAHVSASVGGVASAGLAGVVLLPRASWLRPQRLKSAWSLRALCGQRVGGAMGTWALSWGAGGGVWLPGGASSS